MASAPPPAYPWYAVVSGRDLQQGDIFLDCPVFVIPVEATRAPGNLPVTVQRLNVIVLTQSCDLALRSDGLCAVEDVILSPIYSRQELAGHKTFGKPQGWEEARKGRFAGYHVLNKCELPGQELDFMLVDPQRVFTLSVDMVREVATTRSEPFVCCLPTASTLHKRSLAFLCE